MQNYQMIYQNQTCQGKSQPAIHVRLNHIYTCTRFSQWIFWEKRKSWGKLVSGRGLTLSTGRPLPSILTDAGEHAAPSNTSPAIQTRTRFTRAVHGQRKRQRQSEKYRLNEVNMVVFWFLSHPCYRYCHPIQRDTHIGMSLHDHSMFLRQHMYWNHTDCLLQQ